MNALLSGKEAAVIYEQTERSWWTCGIRETFTDGERMNAKLERSALAVAEAQRVLCVEAVKAVPVA